MNGVVRLPTGTFATATTGQRAKARFLDVACKVVSQLCGVAAGAVGAATSTAAVMDTICTVTGLWMGFIGYDLLAMRITGRRAWGRTSFGRQLAGIVVLDGRTGQPVGAVRQAVRDILGTYGMLRILRILRNRPDAGGAMWHDRMCRTHVVQVPR
ncbi:hypothetical protein ACQUSR_09135 [Streptomyces sp. P1-3]|uniref:hypothetical protein n=1 Tax=Streptomyces sp. P1-3 TaxID=3421658 RepID=UPI003D35FC59